MSDMRDGTMQSVNGPLPPEQARIFRAVPAKWEDIPEVSLKVSSLVLRALKERGLIETRWDIMGRTSTEQWRRRA